MRNAHPADRSSGSGSIAIRSVRPDDVPDIRAVYHSIYGHTPVGTYPEEMLRGQLERWPAGQFVALDGERVVGHAAAFVIDGDAAFSPHTWAEITGGGYAGRHDPNGDYLYAMDVVVALDCQGRGVGKMLYEARRSICRELGLRGIVMGGRIPSYAARAAEFPDVADYVREVVEGRAADPVLNFQLGCGYEVIGVLPDYLPSDVESLGFGVKLIWRNGDAADD
jgi:GNAT superfamily N-acetyltransferase